MKLISFFNINLIPPVLNPILINGAFRILRLVRFAGIFNRETIRILLN